MPLSPGERLGPYEVLSLIGAGGMGEVYKARDTRLDRIVAVKVSKTEFDPRFEREARAIGALKHNNICTLYDVGPNYLVMEFVEGAELKGPLPVSKAVELACQILDALDEAHRKGFTHRDLKPANVMVTKSGVKVLDFGLAKQTQSAGIGPDAPTALTTHGEIAGTLFYIAPEQLQGKDDVDSRADIFSFGCVLYEMLTGKRAFEGKDTASVIAAVMERPVPSVGEVAPVALDRVLKKCLEKDRDDRWQSVRDVKTNLQWAVETSTPTTAPSQPRFGSAWMAAAAVLAVVATVLGVTTYRTTRPAAPKPLVRLDVDLGADVSLSSQRGADVILSPDGTRLVYVSKGKLFTRRLDQPKATELAGTGGGHAPFFSPDGQWVAFFVPGKLKKISVEGSAPVVLCDAPLGFGGSWGDDGNIIASLGGNGGLSRIPAAGGAPAPVNDSAMGGAWPQVLPGAKAVLFTAATSRIDVFSFADHRQKIIVPAGIFAKYVATSNTRGFLVYMNNGRLFALDFDLNSLQTSGAAVPVVEQVAWDPGIGFAQFDVSQNGVLLYRAGGAGGGEVTVQWLDGQGRTQPLLAKPGRYDRLRLSADGQRLALEIAAGTTRDIWLYQEQLDTMTRLTFDAGRAAGMSPVWSPDGRYIVFRGQGGIYWTRSDGAGKPQALTQSGNVQFPSSFTPDGKRVAWYETTTGSSRDLWTMPLEYDGAGLRGGKPEVLLHTSFDNRHPAFAPDGRWLAYSSNESGTFQVYVRAFPDNGGKWQISNAGGIFSVWARNGRELFFESPEHRIMVAAWTAKGDSFTADPPKVWSEKQLAMVALNPNYDVAPDGKRIAALMPAEDAQAQHQVIFLENFLDELRRKVPAGGK